MAHLDIHPLTSDRWDDLVALFGDNGAYGNCWCTWFRQTAGDFGADGQVRMESAGLFSGKLDWFEQAGFAEVRRRSARQPVVARDL